MEESLQTTLIQTITVAVLMLTLFQVAMLLLASFKRQINSKKIFDLDQQLLQKRIDQKALEINLIERKNENTWAGYRKFTIQKKEFDNTTGICSFYLTAHNGKTIPAFHPGQHLFFRLNIPGQKKPLLRCYSISSSPFTQAFYRISIKLAAPPANSLSAPVGIVSNYFHHHLKQGDIVDVRAPSGNFSLNLLSHKPVVLIAGGIGITPLLSMLNAICDSGHQRETWLFFSIKNKKSFFMQEHLIKLKSEFKNIHIHICFSQPELEDIQEKICDHDERASVALLKKILPSLNYEFYLCGSITMISGFKEDLTEWGVAEKFIHYELFTQAKIKTKIEAKIINDSTTIIQFSKSKKSLHWNSTQNSILDLALSNGINIDYSCRRGMCGLCQTTVKLGEVYYDETPEFLSNLEEGMCLPCIAKTKNNLELYA